MTKAEQTRLMAWRLRVLQEAGAGARNVAQTCRRFGLSRRTFYKWRKRYKDDGAAGLCDRPRTPHRSPQSTPREVVSKILYLRQNYHFGPSKIADYLKRFHSVAIAASSVHRILGRHGRIACQPIRSIGRMPRAGSGMRNRSLAIDCRWT